MKIIVCIKSVMVRPPGDGGGRSAENTELNPYDRPAIDMALELAGKKGQVTALTMGPPSAEDALFEALALGVHKAVLISDPALAGADTLATSTVLAAAIKKIGMPDLVVFGVRTLDSDTGQVGPQTAVLLGLPLITWVSSAQIKKKKIEAERLADGFRERCEASLPAAVTVRLDTKAVSDVPLQGIEQAFSSGEIETMGVADLGLEPGRVGLAGSATKVVSMTRAKKERKCEMIEGSTEEQAQELLRRLLKAGLID